MKRLWERGSRSEASGSTIKLIQKKADHDLQKIAFGEDADDGQPADDAVPQGVQDLDHLQDCRGLHLPSENRIEIVSLNSSRLSKYTFSVGKSPYTSLVQGQINSWDRVESTRGQNSTAHPPRVGETGNSNLVLSLQRKKRESRQENALTQLAR